MTMRILIVGAGIAGLSLSAFLRQKGFDPVVIEKTPKLTNIGFVMGLWQSGTRLLGKIGLRYKVFEKGKVITAHTLMKSDGTAIASISFEEIIRKYGDITILDRDALRTSSPLVGMGASMAIEDAYVLAEELSSGTGIQEAFSLFRRRRKGRSRIVRGLSQGIEFAVRLKPAVSTLRDLAITKLYRILLIRTIDRFVGGKI